MQARKTLHVKNVCYGPHICYVFNFFSHKKRIFIDFLNFLTFFIFSLPKFWIL